MKNEFSIMSLHVIQSFTFMHFFFLQSDPKNLWQKKKLFHGIRDNFSRFLFSYILLFSSIHSWFQACSAFKNVIGSDRLEKRVWNDRLASSKVITKIYHVKSKQCSRGLIGQTFQTPLSYTCLKHKSQDWHLNKDSSRVASYYHSSGPNHTVCTRI